MYPTAEIWYAKSRQTTGAHDVRSGQAWGWKHTTPHGACPRRAPTSSCLIRQKDQQKRSQRAESAWRGPASRRSKPCGGLGRFGDDHGPGALDFNLWATKSLKT